MDGVQFVLHNPVYETVYSWGWSWVGFLAGLYALISFVGIIVLYLKDNIEWLIFLFAFIISALYSGNEFCTAVETKEYLYSTYEVVLHDDVDYKAFIEKYEILEVKGDFYTIKERDDYGKTD